MKSLNLTVGGLVDIFNMSTKLISMKKIPTQKSFRYRVKDSESGVSRSTVKKLSEYFGVDEAQIIHMALRDLAIRFLPQYEADDGPLSKGQIKELKKSALKPDQRIVRSSLFDDENF